MRTVDGVIKRWSIYGASGDLSQVHPRLSERTRTIGYGRTRQLEVYVEGTKNIVIATPGSSVQVEHEDKIEGFALSPQEDMIAAYGWSNTVGLWRILSGERLHLLRLKDTVSNVTFSANGHLLAAGTFGLGGPGETRTICVWDVHSGDLWCELKGHLHQVHALAFDPQSRWLVSASLDRTVRLWQFDYKTPSNSCEVWQLYYEDLEFDKISVLSDGRIIVFRQYVLEVWQAQKKILNISVPYHFESRWYITKDETCILGTFKQQVVRRWSLETGQESPAYRNDIIGPEFLPSPTVTFNSHNSFRSRAGCYLWRTTAGNFVHVGDGPRGWVTLLTLSNDGDIIVIPGLGEAALIDLESSQELISLFPFEGKLRASCILSNQILLLDSSGKLFVSGGVE